MVKQITEKSIGHRIRFHVFYSASRWLYFEVDKMPKRIKSLANYMETIREYPRGIYALDTTVENKIFQIQYDESIITEKKVIDFANSLDL